MPPHPLPNVLGLRFTIVHDIGLIQHSHQSTQTTYQRNYLEGCIGVVMVITDHKPLTLLMD